MNAGAPDIERYTGARGCFSIISDRSVEAIAVIDAEGVLRYANTAWVKMHGYSNRDEVLGRTLSDFHSSEQMAGNVKDFLRQLALRGHVSGPLGHTRKDGREIPTHTHMLALKAEQGKKRGAIIFAIDLDKLEQLRQDIIGLKRKTFRHTEELEQAAKKLEKQVGLLTARENTPDIGAAELAQVVSQLRQYIAQTRQIQMQCDSVRNELAEKEKQIMELTRQLDRQKAEELTLKRQWEKKQSEMTSSIDKLKRKVTQIKHQEVEYLEDIDKDAQRFGAKGGIDLQQLKEISDMAKRFAAN